MAGKGNVETTNTNPSVKPLTPYDVMIRAMAMDATAEDGNFGGDDLNVILSAETEEELFDSDERPPLNFQHLAGCHLEIVGIDVKFSRGNDPTMVTPFITRDERGNEKKMYLLVKCFRISDAGDMQKLIRLPAVGEVFIANTSARFVVTKLWRAQTLGLFDENQGITWPVLVQSTELGDDRAVIKLRPLPKLATRAATAE